MFRYLSKNIMIIAGVFVWLWFVFIVPGEAGNLDSPAGPGDVGSAMYTLTDIYNRLDSGISGEKRIFTGPETGPAVSTPTLNELMEKAPLVDGNAAVADEVKNGKVFWGLSSGEWGRRTGTMPTRTLSAESTAVEAGYYEESDLRAVDGDLASGNIRSGVTIFVVEGTFESGSGGGSGVVPKTGQTTSYRTGDDGDLQKGTAWPDPRFSDHGNGTVTDNLTGLMWVKSPHGLAGNSGSQTWNNAIDFCNGLTHAGHSDWRLPNVRELQSLIDYGRSWHALPSEHPFTGVLSSSYWSSTTNAIYTDLAWYVSLGLGHVLSNLKSDTNFVWPVRAGE